MNNTIYNISSSLIKNGFIGFIVWLIFCICLFFIIRELTLWYFRINKNTESLGRIADSLEKIAVAAEFFTTDLVETHNNKIVSEKIVDDSGLEKDLIFEEKKIN